MSELGSLFRYEAIVFSAGVDEWDNPLGPGVMRVLSEEFQIIKRTPKGAWIWYRGRKRFVNLGTRKRLAHETKHEALEALIRRKEFYIGHLNRRIGGAKQAIRLAKELLRMEASCISS